MCQLALRLEAVCPHKNGEVFCIMHLPNTFWPWWQYRLRGNRPLCFPLPHHFLSHYSSRTTGCIIQKIHHGFGMNQDWPYRGGNLPRFFISSHRSLYIDCYVKSRATGLSHGSTPITITRSRWHATQMLAAQNQPNKLIMPPTASSLPRSLIYVCSTFC